MDTAQRLVMSKYYNNSQSEMVAALAEIKVLGCDFLVAGRLRSTGERAPLFGMACLPFVCAMDATALGTNC